jgi:predicted TIM-barrel fold metal-dependent hydrolase
MPTLTKLMPASHIIFGTDYPSVTADVTAKGLSDFGLSASTLSAIERDNAILLFPRLTK